MLEHGIAKRGAEDPLQPVGVVQRQGLGRVKAVVVGSPAADQRPERGPRVGFDRVAPAVAAEEPVGQGQAGGLCIPLGVRLEVLPEVVGARLGRRRDVVQRHLELLREAAADEDVVLVEIEGEGFAIQDLLAHPVHDEPRQLVTGRRTPPLGLPQGGQGLQLVAVDDDAAVVGRRPVSHQCVQHEEPRPRPRRTGSGARARTAATGMLS